MLKKGILRLFLITFVFSYIIVTLYNGGANEVRTTRTKYYIKY